MPYAGGVYTVPPGTLATTLTPIDSSDYNAFIADVEAAQNFARPIVAGGTGAQTAEDARENLGLEIGVDVMAYSASVDAILAAWTGASSSGPASLDFAEDTDNGSNKITLKGQATLSADRVLTLPDAGADDTLAALNATQKLTNKRIKPRVLTITSNAAPTVNTDSYDAVDITALAAAVTSMTTNLSGTPDNFDKLLFRIKDNGTARAISWGSSFEAAGQALPTTTVISKRLTVGFIYDSTTSKWGCVASVQEA